MLALDRVAQLPGAHHIPPNGTAVALAGLNESKERP